MSGQLFVGDEKRRGGGAHSDVTATLLRAKGTGERFPVRAPRHSRPVTGGRLAVSAA